MFFIFSKLLAFLITPLVWIIALFIYAMVTKNDVRRKKSLRWSLGFLLFFTNPFLFDEVTRVWEIEATPYEKLEVHDVGIVLGGMSSYDPTLSRVQFYRGVDRLLQAVELYKMGKIKKIIFTGGSGSILHPDMKEGNYINRFIVLMGVPLKDFWIESESQNTHENALFTKALLEEKKEKGSLLLITSGFHMRRSLGCFETVGLTVEPYSTDRYSGPRRFEFDHMFIPNSSTINDWNNLIHEMVGYLTYWFAGYA